MTAPLSSSKNKTATNSMLIMLTVCASIATWVNLGTLHRSHTGDSLIPILVSLYRWTPFYWEQDRIGMLIPLLARPFRSPLVNLLVQDGLTTWCGLMAMFLLPRYVLRDATWPVVGALAVGAFVALLAAGALAGRQLAHLSRFHDASFALLPPVEWADSWGQLVANAWLALRPHEWETAMLGTGAVGLCSLVVPVVRRNAGTALRVAG